MIEGASTAARDRDRKVRELVDELVFSLSPVGKLELAARLIVEAGLETAHELRAALASDPVPSIQKGGESEEARLPLPVSTTVDAVAETTTTEETQA